MSLVQMQSGRRADLAAILAAAERVGARVLLDATQALPFLDQGEDLSRVDHLLTHGYKHLLCPRGVAFMAVRPDRGDGRPALFANWRAADRPDERFFEGPLGLGCLPVSDPTEAREALAGAAIRASVRGGRRFDVLLAWLSWVGARESLRLLRDWRARGLLDLVRARADLFAPYLVHG